MAKILLAANNLTSIGGSELFHYELTRELYSLGHTVYLLSYNSIIHDPYFTSKIKEHCTNLYFPHTLPNNLDIDVMQLSQPQPTQFCLQKFPNVPAISVIHSEIRSEDPILDSKIKCYIGIRQSICDMLINEYKIDKNKVHLIYNPIDFTRFNTNNVPTHSYRKIALFVGECNDIIRMNSIVDFTQTYLDQGYEIHLVSKSRFPQYHSHVIKFHDPHFDIQYLTKMASITGGILLGRTTIEGFCCGIPGVIYDIDIQGNILNKKLCYPPENITIYNSKYVVKQILSLFN